jgi:hypothetical protein
MVKLLIISVTYNMPQNRISGTIIQVTLNTINGVIVFKRSPISNWDLPPTSHCKAYKVIKLDLVTCFEQIFNGFPYLSGV